MRARLGHLGIIVRRYPAAAAFYRRLGLVVGGREAFPRENVRIAFISVGDVRIELLEPLAPTGPLVRFLGKRGEGIHHLAFEVPDLDEGLARAQAAGLRPIDASPRRGAGGTRVAFLHPDAAHGVLIELVEASQEQLSDDHPA